jgi:hypothetical protein
VEVIQRYGGKDATFKFYDFHKRIELDSPRLERYCIGVLENSNSLKKFAMMFGIGQPKGAINGAKEFVKIFNGGFKSGSAKMPR